MLMPLTMGSLVLVAASFVFGPLRTVAAGTRVFYGVVTGLSFKYLQDLLAPASTVFGFSPAWAVLAPTLICAGLGLYLLTHRLTPGASHATTLRQPRRCLAGRLGRRLGAMLYDSFLMPRSGSWWPACT
jgi:hypothetical protein